MSATFIARAEASGTGAVTTYDLPAVSFQAGDLLIFGVAYSAASYMGLSSVVDVGAGSFPFTLDGNDGNGTTNQLELGHILSAPSAGTNVIFRVTWPSVNTGVNMIFVEVWRPSAGVTMQLDRAKAVQPGTSAAPTSVAINTSANSLVFAFFSGGYSYQKTAPLIAGQAADMYPAAPAQSSNGVRLALELASPQTGITAQYTLSASRGYCSQIIAFKEYSSYVNQPYAGEGTVTNPAASSGSVVQEQRLTGQGVVVGGGASGGRASFAWVKS